MDLEEFIQELVYIQRSSTLALLEREAQLALWENEAFQDTLSYFRWRFIGDPVASFLCIYSVSALFSVFGFIMPVWFSNSTKGWCILALKDNAQVRSVLFVEEPLTRMRGIILIGYIAGFCTVSISSYSSTNEPRWIVLRQDCNRSRPT